MPNTEPTAADGRALAACTAGPQDARRALAVIREIFGVNRHMRRVGGDFAAAGCAVVAPALFDRTERGVELGYGPEGVACGRELRGRVDAGKAPLAASAAPPKAAKRGIVGHCWGGTVAWHGATRSAAFSASAGWYGGVAAAKDETPNRPVQLHVGEANASIPLADVRAIRAAQPGVEVFVRPGAGHGFGGCEERGSHVARDAQAAQERTLAFSARHLG